MLKGKKTYITALVAIVGAVGAWLTGDMELAAMIQLVVTSVLGATIRSGVATETA